jgi:carbon monoxide dehydrogenase subunit G
VRRHAFTVQRLYIFGIIIVQMVYTRSIEVSRPPAKVFAYVADLSHAAEWDPGVLEARLLGEGPVALGSRFELVALFRGRRRRFEYVVTSLDEGDRIELLGTGDQVTSRDAIAVEPRGAGARLTYSAEIRLAGLRRVAEPFLRGTFRRMGDEALEGLRARLETL